MSYENFQSNNVTDFTKQQQGLNLCDIVGYGNMLQHDLATEGPGMLKAALHSKPETAVLAGASVALVAVGIVASSEVIVGLAGVGAVCCGLGAAGTAAKDAIDHFPKMTLAH